MKLIEVKSKKPFKAVWVDDKYNELGKIQQPDHSVMELLNDEKIERILKNGYLPSEWLSEH